MRLISLGTWLGYGMPRYLAKYCFVLPGKAFLDRIDIWVWRFVKQVTSSPLPLRVFHSIIWWPGKNLKSLPSQKHSLWWLTLVVILVGFRITMETPVCMSVRHLLEQVIVTERPTLNVGGTIQWAGVLDWIKRGKGTGQWHSCFYLS